MADPGFLKGGDFCKGGPVTIHCLVTKICELGVASYIFLCVS